MGKYAEQISTTLLRLTCALLSVSTHRITAHIGLRYTSMDRTRRPGLKKPVKLKKLEPLSTIARNELGILMDEQEAVDLLQDLSCDIEEDQHEHLLAGGQELGAVNRRLHPAVHL